MNSKIFAFVLFFAIPNNGMTETISRSHEANPFIFNLVPQNQIHFLKTDKEVRLILSSKEFLAIWGNNDDPLASPGIPWREDYNKKKYHYNENEHISAMEHTALYYLDELAKSTKKLKLVRWLGGIPLTLGGIFFIAGGGYSAINDKEIANGLSFIGIGAATAAGGILAMDLASRAERKLEELQKTSDLEMKERAAHNILASLAAKGRVLRFLGFSISTIACVVSLFVQEGKWTGERMEYKPPYRYTVIFGAVSIYQLLVRTPEEKIYRKYLEDCQRQKELGFLMSVGPKGGVKAGLMYSF